MGTWGGGPFDNDGAADFLEEVASSPLRVIDGALRAIEKAAPTAYLDVDDGTAAWAACELVALSFGFGEVKYDHVVGLLARIRPNEKQRIRALSILPRLADRKGSELAGLWAENGEGPDHAVSRLDVSFADLRARLEKASAGARAVTRPKAGDVLLLAGANEGEVAIVLQVVSAREVAVFEGTAATDDEALARVKTAPARRVLASANKLVQKARGLGNVPLRKNLKGKKLYAHDSGSLERYFLATAAVGGLQPVSYDEARAYDLAERHGESALRAVAAGTKAVGRVRSPDAHEAEIRAHHADEWARSRATTTPEPFGDLAHLEAHVKWVEDFGVDHFVNNMHGEAVGSHGYGRPSERDERGSYETAGIVALWCGGMPRDTWPVSLQGRLPETPSPERLAVAVMAARVLASKLITRDAALRMIWDQAPDGGEAFRRSVVDLQKSLDGL